MLTRSLSLNGLPGSGKSYAVAKMAVELGVNAVVVDFEEKFEQTIKLHFPFAADQFEIISCVVKNTKSKTKLTANAAGKFARSSMDLVFKHGPDYAASFELLIDEENGILNRLLDRSDMGMLVFDGCTPMLRNSMGLAYWLRLHPDRDSPTSLEWGTMNQWEATIIDAGRGWAEDTGGLFVCTGQMEDVYREGSKKGESVKVGMVPAIKVKSQHSIDVVAELTRTIYSDHTEYWMTILDSIVGQKMSQVTLERGVFEILVELGLIGYE